MGVYTTIVYNWTLVHIPLVHCRECEAILVFHHVLVTLLSQRCFPLVYVWFDTLPSFIYS